MLYILSRLSHAPNWLLRYMLNVARRSESSEGHRHENSRNAGCRLLRGAAALSERRSASAATAAATAARIAVAAASASELLVAILRAVNEVSLVLEAFSPVGLLVNLRLLAGIAGVDGTLLDSLGRLVGSFPNRHQLIW